MQKLREGKPFTIDGLLFEGYDITDYERKLLFYFLCGHLNNSLEYFLRNYCGWNNQLQEQLCSTASHIEKVIIRLKDSTEEMINSMKNLPFFWQAKYITYEWIQKCKNKALSNSVELKHVYYKVTDNEDILTKIICADLDYPNYNTLNLVIESLEKSKRHHFIIGNGGEGKTSLLFRLAVEYAKIGHLCFWLRLNKGNIIYLQQILIMQKIYVYYIIQTEYIL
jgi:hypothetical protein